MKFRKVLLTGLSLVASVLFTVGLAACGGTPDGPDGPGGSGSGSGSGSNDHVCTSKCPECGLCLDLTCNKTACREKCGDALNYNYIFDVTSLRVAKTNGTVNPGGGCVEDFTKTQDASIVYKLKASDAATVTLTAYVSETAEEDVFTDSIEVKVNNGEKLSRAAKIPAGEDGAWAQVNLGCIDLQKGSNEISFVAQGDGVKAHKFQKIELYGDLDSIELEQAQGLWHDCTSKCEVCGKCTNFSCYNSGCAEKCECESGAPAHIFWVCDERVKANRDVNKELDGIGCSWGKCTTMVYTLTSPETKTVKYGAVVSVDTSERLFTDQFTVTVNGEKVPAGTGAMPVGPERLFNEYHLVIVGEMTLQKGINVIRIDQDLVGKTREEWKTAYNFQSLIFFTDLDIDWSESEHTLQAVPEVEATCKTEGTKAHWVCTDEDCGKLFLDEFGVEEADAAALVIPADETKHVFDIFEDKVVCTVCETEMTNIFSGLDEKVLFEELKGDTYEPAEKTMSDDQTTDGKGYLPNVNKTVRRITFFISASKATEAYLWTNNSAIATHYLVEYGKTWVVYVNGTEYTSKTIHHNTDGGGGTDKWRNFKFEFVAKIGLLAGVNKIEFVSTGAESCNFRDLGLMGSDATFTLAEGTPTPPPDPTPAHECESKCIICGKCTNVGCTEEACTEKCTAHKVKGTFDPLDDKVVFEKKNDTTGEFSSEGAVKDAKNEGHVGFSNAKGDVKNIARLTFYIQSDKATTADLWTNVSAIASGSVNYTDSWTVTVNGTEISSETIHHIYDKTTSSAANRYFDYAYEFVANISLKAGVNVIEFTSTGAQALNFDMLVLGNLGDETASVTLTEKPASPAQAAALPATKRDI